MNRLDNVYLYDIDGLQGVVDSNLEERKAAARRADDLIVTEVDAYGRWWQSQGVNQLVVALKRKLGEIGQAEIERMRRKFGPVNEQQEQAIEQLAHGMVGKLLHLPIRHLKEAAQRGTLDDVQELYRELFGIEPADAEEVEPGPGESDDSGDSRLGPRRAIRGGKDR